MPTTTLEVKVVTEKEWERLRTSSPRYEHVEDDNMGFADPRVGKAYVRQTFWPELNKYLLTHEFEHLLEEEGTDEDEHGIRHKKFFKSIAPFLFPVLGALGGPALGGLFAGAGGLSGLGSALAAGAGGAAGGAAGKAIQGGGGVGKAALLGGLGGAGSSILGQGVGKFLGGLGNAPSLPTNPTASITSAPGGTGNIASKLLGQSTSSLLGDTAQFGGAGGVLRGFSPSASLAGSLAPGGLGTQFTGGNTFPSGVPTPPPSGGSNLLGGLSKFTGIPGPALGAIGVGGGIAGLGQFLGNRQAPKIPDLSGLPSVQAFSQQSQTRLQPLIQQLAGLQNQPLPEALASPIMRQFDEARRQLYNQFQANAPGSDLVNSTGPTGYRQGYLDIAQRQSESLNQAQQAYQGQQRQNILAQAGLTEDQLSVLGNIASLDIQTIMARTGLSADQANQFKQIFGQLGGAIAGAGVLSQFTR